jgi:hypothetical protein
MGGIGAHWAALLMRLLMKQLFLVLAYVVILGAFAFVCVDLVQTLLHTPRATTNAPQPDAIVWGNRVFGAPHEFKRWLHSRGASYSHWRKRFPAEARVLEHRPPLPATTTSVTTAATTATVTKPTKTAPTKTTAEHTVAPRASVANNGGARRGLMLWFLMVAAVIALVWIVARAHSRT